MADLSQLVNEALGSIIQSGGLPNVESLYNQQAQGINENLSARGLGISSVTRDALAKARVDANLAAQQAQLSALGQAASVAQQELNRGQAGSQFQQSLGLQKKALGQQSDIARNNLMAQGLGLGVGGLANVAGRTFGPEIQGTLRRLAGLSPMGTGAGGSTELGGIGQQIQAPTQIGDIGSVGGNISAPDFTGGWDVGGLGSVGLPDLTGLASSVPDLSWVGDLGTTFGLDALSGLTGAATSVPDFSMLWAP